MNDNLRGALLMTLAMAAFTANDAAMKHVFGTLPFYQSITLRSAMTAVLLFLIAYRRDALRLRFPRRDRALIAWRTFAEVASTIAFLTALTQMPLATLTAILQVLPLAVTLAGALFLGEAVGWRRLTAIGIGFVGVMLIVRPGTDGFDANSVLGLVAVAFVVLRDLTTRRMSGAVPSITVALISSLAVGAFGLAGSLTQGWAPVTPAQWAGLGMASASIVVGYLTIVMAMRVGEIALVTPFRYTGLVWALVLGFLVFGDWPDGITLFGAAIVVATGLFTFWRERRLAAR